ncbi:MAG: secreted protein [Pseudonocardiales bacterium]|nr:secreted protein [Pseudonocardiales bacterium]
MSRQIGLRIGALIVVSLIGFGLYWFEPWRLLTNTRVDEAAPVAAVLLLPTAAAPVPQLPADVATSTVPPAPRMGRFISYEHPTSGTASIVEVSPTERYIRIENLDTSDGPDLHVYLSPLEHTAGMHAFGEDAVELGQLKGNLGNQNYLIPVDLDIANYRTVVIWCKRFAVAFGAAPLA